MNTYKTITYKSKNGDVNCYVIDGQIYLSQKDMSHLFNLDVSRISRRLKKIEENYSTICESAKRFRKIEIVNSNIKTKLYDMNYLDETAKQIGDFSIIDFHNWASNAIAERDDEQYKIVRYNQDNIEIDVHVDPNGNTVWLSQEEVALLLNSSQQNISYHIRKIYKDGELEKGATHKYFLLVQTENDRPVTRNVIHYNLDMIISLGFRVNSRIAIDFRKWANSVLKQLLLYGYSLSVPKNNEYQNILNKLLSMDNEVIKHGLRINRLEQQYDTTINEMIIKDGQFFDGVTLLERLCSEANERIILIDAYADSKALNVIKNKKNNVDVLLLISNNSRLSKTDISLFQKQYGPIHIVRNDGFHDRYLFIDNSCYHLGTSINYLGKRISQIDELTDKQTIEYLLSRVTCA